MLVRNIAGILVVYIVLPYLLLVWYITPRGERRRVFLPGFAPACRAVWSHGKLLVMGLAVMTVYAALVVGVELLFETRTWAVFEVSLFVVWLVAITVGGVLALLRWRRARKRE